MICPCKGHGEGLFVALTSGFKFTKTLGAISKWRLAGAKRTFTCKVPAAAFVLGMFIPHSAHHHQDDAWHVPADFQQLNLILSIAWVEFIFLSPWHLLYETSKLRIWDRCLWLLLWSPRQEVTRDMKFTETLVAI